MTWIPRLAERVDDPDVEVYELLVRVLRQIAILVVDRVALDQHTAAFAVVADPVDDAAPGDVLTVERLEIDRSQIFHVNDLGFPARGEEQSKDESKTGHGVSHRQGRKDVAPSARWHQASAPVKPSEFDPDHAALFCRFRRARRPPRLPDVIRGSCGMNEKRDQKDDRQRNADQPK